MTLMVEIPPVTPIVPVKQPQKIKREEGTKKRPVKPEKQDEESADKDIALPHIDERV